MAIQFGDSSKLLLVMGSVALGILLMASMLAVSIVAHPLPPEAAQAARVLLSIGAGLAAAGLAGSLKFDAKWQEITLTAGGGFGVFALVYLVEPGVFSLLGLT